MTEKLNPNTKPQAEISDEELNDVSGGIPAVRRDEAKCVPFPKAPTPKFDPRRGSDPTPMPGNRADT